MYVEGEVPNVTSCNNGGLFGGNGIGDLVALIVVAGLFGGFGNGFGFGGNNGANANYVLASDFATIQRQLSDGFGGVEKGLDTIRNGLCDGFYTEAQLINGVNTNIMQGVNTLQSQLASCCCDTQRSIDNINYNMAKNTCDIIQAGHNDTQRIVDLITANTIEAKNNKIAEQQALISSLQLRASQEAQNNYLVNALRPSPTPAYVVANPYCCNNCNSCM